MRASAVCQSWLQPAVSVRKSKKPPWLISYPEPNSSSGDMIFQLYDPLNRKMHYLELPELRGSRICYSKGDWLIFFFSPYTREKIKIAKFSLADHLIAFSDPPASATCALFTLSHVAAVSTCHPWAAGWTTVHYHSPTPFPSSIWNKLVFSKGLFCCFSLAGWLGVYGHEHGTWTVSSEEQIHSRAWGAAFLGVHVQRHVPIRV